MAIRCSRTHNIVRVASLLQLRSLSSQFIFSHSSETKTFPLNAISSKNLSTYEVTNDYRRNPHSVAPHPPSQRPYPSPGFNSHQTSNVQQIPQSQYYTHQPRSSDQIHNRVYMSFTTVEEVKRLCKLKKYKDAIGLLDKGALPDKDCFFLLFESCADLKSLEHSNKVHDHFLQSKFRSDPKLNNVVISMFGECRSVTHAERVFDHMADKDMDSWHLMMRVYSDNEMGDDALQLFEEIMKQGLKPNEDTFLSVFLACANVGGIKEAFLHFDSMRNEFGISPRTEHYLGLLDVLGKCGHLAEAEQDIHDLPFEATSVFWEAMRSYGKLHGDIDVEDYAEELMVDLDPSKAVTNKLSSPPRKSFKTISMVASKSRVCEFRNLTFYKDETKEMAAKKGAVYVPDTRCVISSKMVNVLVVISGRERTSKPIWA